MSAFNNNKINKPNTVKVEDFSEDEQRLIASRLDQQLGPEFVSTRPGAGGVRVSYIEGWKAINLANTVFGFNGWFSEVKNVQVDYLDEKNGKFNVGLSIVVRVTLKDGSFHEDVGYGSLDNARTKAMAFEKAKKEAMTDGLKRALRNFGNAMGNCLYDKDFLSKIGGVKCAPPDFDEANLMRLETLSRPGTIPGNPVPQPNKAPVKPVTQAPQNREDLNKTKVNGNLAPAQPNNKSIPEKRTLNTTSHPNKRPSIDLDDAFDDSLLLSDDLNLESEDFNDEMNELINSKLKTPALGEDNEESEPAPEISNPTTTQEQQTNNDKTRAEQETTTPIQIGFFKARAAEDLQKNSPAALSETFNPHFISPSIRRTVDPTKSTPIKRTAVPEPKSIRYDDPALIPNRQVGKPRYPPPRKLRGDKGESTGSQSASNGEK